MIRSVVAVAALLSASSASAITYVGSISAGGSTATYTVVTDGTLGVLTTANIVSGTGIVTNGSGSTAFDGSFNQLSGATTIATATQLLFNTAADGFLVLGQYTATFAGICISGTGIGTCTGETTPSIYVARAYPDDFGLAPAEGTLVIGSVQSAVPETASWAMLIAGFGLTGAALRKRRQAALA